MQAVLNPGSPGSLTDQARLDQAVHVLTDGGWLEADVLGQVFLLAGTMRVQVADDGQTCRVGKGFSL